ncbi:helix-turn-helix transcriptional regulator [Aureimonas sp. SK2]|uniref:helix-turn-helix domain-containing protein n=1 Tax=Aureimonas sp. SK2 TaxID=3015992 RepID=UPI0024445FEE|nr:helix-turn-helix transcriptional regulator [Aureimonas sp. SK2]
MQTQRAGPIDVCIGENIRAIRHARGLSLAQVGEALGVSYVHLQMYEKARARITFTKLCVLSDLLHVPVSAFFATLDDPATKQPIPSVEIEEDLFFFRLDELDPVYMSLIGLLAEQIKGREGKGKD